MRLDINSSPSWKAIAWYRDNFWDVNEPEFREGFERMFNCKIVAIDVTNTSTLHPDSVPEYLDFNSDQHYTMFMLKWS